MKIVNWLLATAYGFLLLAATVTTAILAIAYWANNSLFYSVGYVVLTTIGAISLYVFLITSADSVDKQNQK